MADEPKKPAPGRPPDFLPANIKPGETHIDSNGWIHFWNGNECISAPPLRATGPGQGWMHMYIIAAQQLMKDDKHAAELTALRLDYEAKLAALRQEHDAKLAEVENRLKQRRVRETTIPWIELNARVAARMGMKGLPQDVPGRTAHQELVQIIEEELEALAAKASRSMVQEHATKLLKVFEDVGQRRPHRAK
jgi:hypothetical protein